MIVNHWGVHTSDGDVAFLEEEAGGRNALGLSMRSPFRVRFTRRIACNHQIPLEARPAEEHIKRFRRHMKDPLLRAMLPLPWRGTYMVDEYPADVDMLLLTLERLSSPIQHIIHPVWSISEKRILNEMQATNVQPLVLTAVNATHTQLLTRIQQLSLTMPRTLIVIPASAMIRPMGWKQITTSLSVKSVMALPLESLGGWALRQHMRGEFDA